MRIKACCESHLDGKVEPDSWCSRLQNVSFEEVTTVELQGVEASILKLHWSDTSAFDSAPCPAQAPSLHQFCLPIFPLRAPGRLRPDARRHAPLIGMPSPPLYSTG